MAKEKKDSPKKAEKIKETKVEEASQKEEVQAENLVNKPDDKVEHLAENKPATSEEIHKTDEASLKEKPEPKKNVDEDQVKNKKVAKKSDDEEPKAGAKPKESPKEGAWYVVHTYSGHENKVAATLKQKIEASHFEDKIFDVMVPTQEKIEIREGKKQKLRERIFPGYILVQMKLDDQSWYTVRSTAGVTGFVGIGNKPTPLDEEEVKTIQNFSKMEAPTYKASFSIGEAVKIIDGPFSDFIGTIDQINEEKGKLRVLVSIFGRETPVELDFLQASKL